MAILAALLSGLVFGLGIVISGMGNPAKVINFFDLAGSWDPSLAFVMASALAVTAVGYRVVFKWKRPIFADGFHIPGVTRIDMPLIAGSAVFGIGWGLSGFCPGGLIPVLGIGRAEPLIFLGALLVGIVGTRVLRSQGYSASAGRAG